MLQPQSNTAREFGSPDLVHAALPPLHASGAFTQREDVRGQRPIAALPYATARTSLGRAHRMKTPGRSVAEWLCSYAIATGPPIRSVNGPTRQSRTAGLAPVDLAVSFDVNFSGAFSKTLPASMPV